MPTLTHPNGQTTYYEDNNYTDPWKPHTTILIQHGFARHSAFWYSWIPALSRHYRVIRRDARGHGKSSVPPSDGSYDYSLDTILSEIVDTLDQLGLQKVHYLGESTGGIFGEAVAAKYPERLLSLTTCSTPMYLPAAAQEWLAFGHSSWPAAMREMGSRGWAVEGMKLLGTDQIDDKAFLEWWVDEIAIMSGEGLAQHAELLAKLDARTFVGDIKVSMLILAPRNSRMARLEGPDSQTELHERVKGSVIKAINGKGHEIYVDQAEECQRAFLDFSGGLKKEV